MISDTIEREMRDRRRSPTRSGRWWPSPGSGRPTTKPSGAPWPKKARPWSSRHSEHGEFPLRVEKVDPPPYLAYRWVSAFPGEELREGNSTLVEFTLTAEGDCTRLRVVESGFAALPTSEENRAATWSRTTPRAGSSASPRCRRAGSRPDRTSPTSSTASWPPWPIRPAVSCWTCSPPTARPPRRPWRAGSRCRARRSSSTSPSSTRPDWSTASRSVARSGTRVRPEALDATARWMAALAADWDRRLAKIKRIAEQGLTPRLESSHVSRCATPCPFHAEAARRPGRAARRRVSSCRSTSRS